MTWTDTWASRIVEMLTLFNVTKLAASRLSAVTQNAASGRTALEFLAQTGAFLFYGTHTAGLTSIWPQEPLTFNEATNEEEPRGPVGVYASGQVDIAIYRALMSSEAVAPHVRRYASKHFIRKSDGAVQFEASADAISWAAGPDSVGWVYVLDASLFRPCCRLEMRASEAVPSLAAIRVTGVDLPREIVVSTYFERERPHRASAA